MQVRDSESPHNVKPTRVMPAWGVFVALLPLLVSVCGAALLFWKAQGEDRREARVEMDFVKQTLLEIKAESKVTNQQWVTLTTNSAMQNAKQDQQITDLDRRVTRLEANR